MRTALRYAALVEAGTLFTLLVNLASVHATTLTSLVGPVHGTAYLTVIATTFLNSSASVPARVRALIPGVGGLLAIRSLRQREETVP